MRNALSVSFRNELEKLAVRKKYFVLLVITAIIPAAAALAAGTFQGSLGLASIRGMDLPLLILGTFTGFLLPLYTFMVAADLFAGERSDRSVKAILLRPVTRFKVFASKAACIGVYILTHLAVLLAVSLLSGLFLGWGGTFLQGMLPILSEYGAAILPLLMLALLSIMVSQLAGGTTGTLVFSVLVCAGASVLSAAVPGLADFLFTSHVFMVVLAYSIIFFAAGYLLFERKEA